MPEKPTIEQLAKKVLEWASCDAIIKEHGWDGGKHEAAWEDARDEMVKMANAVLEGKPWEDA